MDSLKVSHLESLLRFPGSKAVVSDALVLSCGCLVSESQFAGSEVCPSCSKESVVLKPVPQLRELYRIVQQINSQLSQRSRRPLSLKRSTRLSESRTLSESRLFLDSRPFSDSKTPATDSMDLLALFCKYAKEEHGPEVLPAEIRNNKPAPSEISVSPMDRYNSEIERQRTQHSTEEPYEHILLGLSEKEEYNFSRCFPFHRKHTAFQTQQKFTKLLFKSKTARFSGSAMCARFDPVLGEEKALFVLITDKKWEYYEYTASMGRPSLVAVGRLNGEFGLLAGAMHAPVEGMIVRNEFSGNEKNDEGGADDLAGRLRSWVQLHCVLSDRFLVITGTRGVVRVLNVDSSFGEIGAPVYTYLTNFPIRCTAIAPNNGLIACGITARERLSGKQQPFIILHQIEIENGRLLGVTPITITVPYRDPLKILTFNASSSHLMCCTVYEMRYFIIRLRSETSTSYKRPRLIWLDVTRKPRKDDAPEDTEHDDDQMMEVEGITDVKFGVAHSNTVVVTLSSLKTRPTVVLKLNGPAIDSRPTARFSDGALQVIEENDSDEEDARIGDVDVLMKVPEIGSAIYRVELSPRGDGMVFVDKLGRLLLVSTPNVQLNVQQARKIVVLLGEAADALRFNEAASVKFSTDGGKVFVVDRRGVFQVFDFTKGIPGEDFEVIKCKIISV